MGAKKLDCKQISKQLWQNFRQIGLPSSKKSSPLHDKDLNDIIKHFSANPISQTIPFMLSDEATNVSYS